MKKQKKPASLSLRGGSYSLILTAVVLALVMVLNVLAGALPENMTKYDMSATKLYSVIRSEYPCDIGGCYQQNNKI